MEGYITRMLQTYGMTNCKEADTPCLDVSALGNSKSELASGLPLRRLVGELQWVSTCARPDIAAATAVLAQAASQPVDKDVISAAKKVIRYMASTRCRGIIYSPSIGSEFKDAHRRSLDHRESEPKYSPFGASPSNQGVGVVIDNLPCRAH